MRGVRPVTVCERLVVVTEMSVHSVSHSFVPSFFMYCHLSSAGLPLTDEAMVSSPLLLPVVTVGLFGLPGKVLNLGATMSWLAVAQVVPVYRVNR